MPAGLTAVSVSGPEPVIRQTIFSWSPTRADPRWANISSPHSCAPWPVPWTCGPTPMELAVSGDDGWQPASPSTGALLPGPGLLTGT
jgi:hypothetical protein